MWLVVGLGNPGTQYRGTRHNAGFLVLDELLRRQKNPAAPRAKFGAEIIEAQIGGQRALCCKPMEFMNVSGQAVARVAQFWKIAPQSTVVVHDELDIAFGRLKLGTGGGPGGHNGLRSIIADWGSADFHRVRVGIGRPPPGHDAAAYVLTAFSPAEQKDLGILVAEAADAVETMVAQGASAAMNKFNASNAKKKDEKKDGKKPGSP